MSEIEKVPDETAASASASSRTDQASQQELTPLDALDKLEILPHMLHEGILFAGSGSALLLQAAMRGIRSDDSEHHKNLAT